MPNPQGSRVLIVVVTLAFVAALAGLANMRRASSTPIVIQTPSGIVAPPTPVPVASPISRGKPTASVMPVSAPMTSAVPSPAPQTASLIYVDVTGAVKHPSLYQLPSNSRVWHAIKAAGGANANADEDAVNLAEKLHDGEKVYLPIKTAAAHRAPVIQTASAMSPMMTAPVAVRAAESSVATRSDTGAGKTAKLASPSQGQVNINTASVEQLEALPSIGPAMAARIIGYRRQAGGFQNPEDLMRVGGIGPSKFARIAPFITVH